jgi:hypothetical protein
MQPLFFDPARMPALEDLPNIGPAMAADLRRLGIGSPLVLQGRDPYMLYFDLCRMTRTRHDPCVLDIFIAAVRFVEGAPAKPWWAYTAERQRVLKSQLPAAAVKKAAREIALRSPASRLDRLSKLVSGGAMRAEVKRRLPRGSPSQDQ